MQNDPKHALRFNIREGHGQKRRRIFGWVRAREAGGKNSSFDRSVHVISSLANISLCETSSFTPYPSPIWHIHARTARPNPPSSKLFWISNIYFFRMKSCRSHNSSFLCYLARRHGSISRIVRDRICRSSRWQTSIAKVNYDCLNK